MAKGTNNTKKWGDKIGILFGSFGGVLMEKIGFFRPYDLYGEFSNWYLCDFCYAGQDFISSEQALMWRKAKMFGDEEIAEKILQTTDQGQIKNSADK